MSEMMLEVRNLKKYFNLGGGRILKAVDDVSFYIPKGETLGLVGESGCGKSTTGKTVMKLQDPTEGQIIFDGKDITKQTRSEYIAFTKRAQMIFQDPYTSLDSRMTAGQIISEGMEIHGMYSGAERREKVLELLETVGLNKEHSNRFAHEFSGGQRQRIGVARALAIDPEFIVCDEPISALDVSIQAQIINLLLKLQRERDLTYLFIAHDLSIVRFISDRIVVIYKGQIMEIAETEELFKYPLHDYTKSLMSAIPIPDPILEKKKKLFVYTPKEYKDGDKIALQDIGNGHLVRGTAEEIEVYKKKRFG